MHCKMLNSIPGLYPLDASRISLLQVVTECFQTLPNVSQGALRTTPIDSHCSGTTMLCDLPVGSQGQYLSLSIVKFFCRCGLLSADSTCQQYHCHFSFYLFYCCYYSSKIYTQLNFQPLRELFHLFKVVKPQLFLSYFVNHLY